MSDLEERVKQLEALVQKQQAMLAKTGEQIMKLTLAAQKDDVSELDRRNKDLRSQVNLPNEEQGDFITQDDVVQLVDELQGQLDLVDKRSLLRIQNVTTSTGSDPVSPLPNLSGEEPNNFPKTLSEFEDLDKKNIVDLARFYELLPPDVNEIKDLLTEANVPHTSKEGKEAIEKAEKDEEALDKTEVFNVLARYVGIRSRK